MSVLTIPLILNDNWCSMAPSHIMNHKFGIGMDLEDLLSSITAITRPAENSKPCQAPKPDTNSTVSANKDKFLVNLDVQQFTPEEITIKVMDGNTITVEAKHEEKQDEHGFVSRHLMRRFTIPEGHDINNIVSNLSSDGVLSITAPRIEQTKEEQRTIPINQTGVPSTPIENKKPDN